MNNLFDRTPGHLIASCLTLLLLLLLWHGSTGTYGQGQPTATASAAAAQSSGGEPLVLTVTVSDKRGDPIPGLPQSAFNVLDNNVPQEIIAFNNVDAPFSVGIVLDLYNSIEPYRKQSREIIAALQRFIQSSNDSNDYFIVGRTRRKKTRELLQDWTSDREALRLALEQIPQNKLSGTKDLYDTIDYSVEKLEHGRHARRALLLVSDGSERWSEISQDQLYQHLKNSTVLIYAIDTSGMVIHESSGGMNKNSSDSSSAGFTDFYTLAARQTLNEITSLSGGRMFSKLDPVEIRKAFERTALELRCQYSLTIKPTGSSNKGDGRWHTLKVRVKAPSDWPGERKSMSARTREGYYATGSSSNPR